MTGVIKINVTEVTPGRYPGDYSRSRVSFTLSITASIRAITPKSRRGTGARSEPQCDPRLTLAQSTE
jgi:hypothetical protein